MKDLTVGKPGKLILEFAFPIFIGNLFQLFYSLVDTRIVGSTLGHKALAALSATTTINNLIIGFLIGLTNGFAIKVAKEFGAKNFEELRKDVASTLCLGGLTALLLTSVSLKFLPDILRVLNISDHLLKDASAYLYPILAGMMVAMLYNVCASVLRAIGDTLTPLIFLILSTVMNIVLDYWFILGLHTGVEGAAYATVIAQCIAAVACLIYMLKKYPFLCLKWSDFKLQKKRSIQLLSAGLSMGMMQSLVSLGTVALQGAINTFGDNTIVAHGAARKLTEVYMLPFSVMGMTIATYCGQNYGAGKIRRIKEGIKRAVIDCFIWCGIVILISYTVAPVLIQMITATHVDEVIQTATLYLKVDTLLYFVTVIICIFRNALQGIGDHVTPIISSFIELVGKLMVVFFLAPKLQYMGIILAEPIVWILMVIPLIYQMVSIPALKEKNIEDKV